MVWPLYWRRQRENMWFCEVWRSETPAHGPASRRQRKGQRCALDHTAWMTSGPVLTHSSHTKAQALGMARCGEKGNGDSPKHCVLQLTKNVDKGQKTMGNFVTFCLMVTPANLLDSCWWSSMMRPMPQGWAPSLGPLFPSAKVTAPEALTREMLQYPASGSLLYYWQAHVCKEPPIPPTLIWSSLIPAIAASGARSHRPTAYGALVQQPQEGKKLLHLCYCTPLSVPNTCHCWLRSQSYNSCEEFRTVST